MPSTQTISVTVPIEYVEYCGVKQEAAERLSDHAKYELDLHRALLRKAEAEDAGAA
jgi:hypothetical protein